MACYAIIQVSNRRRFGFYPTLSLIYLIVGYSTGAINTNLMVKSACRTPFILPARYRLNMVVLDKNIGEQVLLSLRGL